MLKKPNRLVLVAFIIALLFDILFWEKVPGISFSLYAIIILVAGFSLARYEEVRVSKSNWFLVIAIVFFSVMTFIRQEPFTRFLNHVQTLFMMSLLAYAFIGGLWPHYNLSDYVVGFFRFSGSVLSQPVRLRMQRKEAEAESGSKPSIWRRVSPYLRGVLIAIPILGFFASLLASADPIFAQGLDEFLKILAIENLPEYLFRLTYILIAAYLFTGIFTHAITNSSDRKLVSDGKPWMPTWLGITESAVVLGAIDLLFAIFVAIQVRYFFGGHTNISVDGYTYAEYARNGFGELVFVAFFSLLLLLSFSQITKRENKRHQFIFSGFSTFLVAMVVVILVSAFQRLLLYETAYGFTRLRIYTHIFMIWLGLLLLAVILLEIRGRLRYFALATLISFVGFTVSINLVNVDSSITKHNVSRAISGKELDTSYLLTLSNDAVPMMVELFAESIEGRSQGDDLTRELAVSIACHAALNQEYMPHRSWLSFHFADHLASRAWETFKSNSEFGYLHADWNDEGYLSVQINDDEILCYEEWYGY